MSKRTVTVALPKSSVSKKLVLKQKEEASEEEVSSSDSDEMDDEVDLDAEVSDDDEGSEEDSNDEESDSDDDENLPKLKKRKKNKDDGNESFANAVNAILSSKLKAYDRKDPIMARSKQTLKKAESEKLESKAKRALLAEKKVIYDKDRIKDLLPKDDSMARAVFDHEKKLKKIAQRGVIRLFNVVMTTQNRTSQEMSNTKVFGEDQKEKLITEISKEKFFDLVKAAGDDDDDDDDE